MLRNATFSCCGSCWNSLNVQSGSCRHAQRVSCKCSKRFLQAPSVRDLYKNNKISNYSPEKYHLYRRKKTQYSTKARLVRSVEVFLVSFLDVRFWI